MKKIIGYISYICWILLLIWGTGYEAMGQCAQCKAAAASRDENGNLTVGGSLNTGVLYLLALPVFLPLIVGGIFWYLARQKRLQEAAEAQA